jgi:hypothetical protein
MTGSVSAWCCGKHLDHDRSAALAEAERHVAEAEQHIIRQRQVIDDLDRHGHDTESARYLLRQFEELHAVHVADRDRLRSELED